MKLFYVTLNTIDEARRIARAALEQRVAVCCNWFPITCAYRWDEEIKEEPEIVLLIKTQDGRRASIEAIVGSVVDYVNCIVELAPSSVNTAFLDWLDRDAPS
ncbi:CutA1 divalent ion tolerance protein [Methylocella silvestris BL2]|uniref:CutA1 divalent ion tolerance protein n=1 Tax=Methylocella silvestris (strain DSM 15510 / CIP 108128 / LMG 27833 / NCIMB 13906 / BL2) TaxID=395965 RepID=B8EKC7_METSB|nr:divalent-cation tolerance protein CutA [Methylocella silvestris]ACK50667.1 CutA1 divalent ion tolerance protein [Methylocella silvestris BL2]